MKSRALQFGVLVICAAGIAQSQEPTKAAPKQIQLRGDRFKGLTYDEMTPEQKALTDRALAGRGTIGTFNILLRSPGLSEAVRGTAGGRAGSPLTQKQAELAIIINARYWTTQFEWLVHHRAAVQAGVSDPTFAAAKAMLGERGIVDLIGLVGFYQATSLMMNVDRYPMQADQKPELKKLESPLP